MKIHTNGLIIFETNFRENDKIIKVLTPDYGIISAISRGARKIKKKNSAIPQIMSYCYFTFYESKSKYFVNDVEIIEIFWGIRNNLVNLSLSQYFCELCTIWMPEIENVPELLRLFLNTLFSLSNNKINYKILKAVFELRGCSLCGYTPNFFNCFKCKAKEVDESIFLIKEGVVLCGKCAKIIKTPYAVNLSRSLFGVITHIVFAPIDKIFSFRVSPEIEEKLCDICEKYIYFHVSDNIKSLKFYKNII